MLNFRYRIKNKDTKRLEELVITSNCVWNYALMIQRKYYEWTGKYLPSSKLQSYIAKKRKKNSYWRKLNSHWVQNIIKTLDESYQRFFAGLQKRPPKFKKRYQDGSILAYWNVSFIDGIKINNDEITLKQFGTYKFIKHRVCGKNICSIRVKRYNNHFYVIICCDCQPKKLARDCDGTAGIDFGLKTFITLDNGEMIESPRFLFKNAKKLRKLNKVVSRRKKGSNRRRKAVEQLSNFHAHVAWQRDDWQWKLAHRLCKQYTIIKIEDLCLLGWVRLWGRKASDLAIGEFIKKLEFVASKYGTQIVKVDRWYASSHICSACGYKLDRKLELNEREWQCPVCGVVHVRDVNAAVNIKRWEPTCISEDRSKTSVQRREQRRTAKNSILEDNYVKQ